MTNVNQHHLQSLNLFVEDILNASLGCTSCLSYIPSSLHNYKPISSHQVFQSIMIGGSHIESARIQMVKGKPVILQFSQHPLQSINSKADLFNIIGQHLHSDIHHLTVSFAFALQPILRENRPDGVVLKSTKEHTLGDLIGCNIGQEIEQFIATSRSRDIQVSVSNNLTSLATGYAVSSKHVVDNVIVGVISTGVNIGFFEKNGDFVNLESGNFCHKNPLPSLSTIDQKSVQPGQQLLEKEIGGSYLYKHINIVAAEKGLEYKLSHQKEIIAVLANPSHPLFLITSEIVKNSASWVALQIAAVAAYKKMPLHKKLAIVMEGWVFWDIPQYRRWVTQFLIQLGFSSRGIEFIKTRQGFLFGAAGIASLSDILFQKKVAILATKVFLKNFQICFSSLAPPR